MADIKKAKDEAATHALVATNAIWLTVLVDKYGHKDDIKNMWKDVNKLADEVTEGRVSLADLIWTLREESGINLKDTIRW